MSEMRFKRNQEGRVCRASGLLACVGCGRGASERGTLDHGVKAPFTQADGRECRGAGFQGKGCIHLQGIGLRCLLGL